LALVAGIVLILTGLVAWMYIRQSRMAQAINALAVAVTTPPPSFLSHPPVHEPEEREHQQEQNGSRRSGHAAAVNMSVMS